MLRATGLTEQVTWGLMNGAPERFASRGLTRMSWHVAQSSGCSADCSASAHRRPQRMFSERFEPFRKQ